MVFKGIYKVAQNSDAALFFNNYANEQTTCIKKYIENYPRKLQLIDAFGKEWDEEEIKRLRAELENIMKIDVSEEEIVKSEEKSIRTTVNELMAIIKHEINSKKKSVEATLLEDLGSLNGKLKTLEKNLGLQEKWLKKNKNPWKQNNNKNEYISLVRQEGATVFDINSNDLKELHFRAKLLLQTYAENNFSENTYAACEAQLKKEIEEFDKDRTDFDVKENVKLGGGFVNPVYLIKTNGDVEYVAKGFAEQGSFSNVLKTKKQMDNAGAITSPIVRVGNNEIIYEKALGKSLSKILTKQPLQANMAFYEFGKSLASIHKKTLDNVKFYSIRSLFRTGHTWDFMRLQTDMRLIKNWEVIPKSTYRAFVKARHFYHPEYISTIHGDAHLDNFFYIGNPETIIVIDYDTTRTGDPLADVGRAVASIRTWQFREKLEEPYIEKVIESFFRGYKSVLNIELRGVNLFALRLYLVKIKSSKPLLDKVSELIKNNSYLANKMGGNLIQFFKSDITKVNEYLDNKDLNKKESEKESFSEEEIKILLEIQFCLSQINNFIDGKDVAVNYDLLNMAA